jgi:putative transposase
MVNYRRHYVAGGTYFFTVTLRDRRSTLLVDQAAMLTEVMQQAHSRRPWETVASVIMPDHLHAIWQLPEGDDDYSGRWRDIKSGFVRKLSKAGHAIARNARGEADIWQSRFWEHMIRDEDDLRRHIDYIHFNPVRHGHVVRVADWPRSTFHRYVSEGILPLNWAGAGDTASEGFGE